MKVTKHITDLIDTLQLRCPIAFPSKPSPKVPLAFHQHKVIQKILDVDYATAAYILQLWCHGRRYDQCCVQGAKRIRCDGVARGVVSHSEAAFHKGRLDAYYEARVAPKGYKVSTEHWGVYTGIPLTSPNKPVIDAGSSILARLWKKLGIIVNTKEETV